MKSPKKPRISWDDLQVVTAAAQSGSLSGAARRLGLSVATVGRRIERLEDAIERKLFRRHAGGLEALPEAALLLERADAVSDQVGNFLRAAVAQQDVAKGTVTISTVETFITHILAPRLARFRKRHPHVQLVLHSSSRVVRLDRHGADIAVRIVRPNEPRVVARKLGTLRYGLYATDAYAQRRGRPKADDLEDHDVVRYDEAWDGLPEMQWLAERMGRNEPAIRVSTAAAIRASIRAGATVGLLPTFLKTREMRVIAGPDQLPTRDIWMVIHEDLRQAAHIRAAADFLVEASEEALH